jgi:hypothetical protein
MKDKNLPNPAISLETILADEKLTRLRRAYHELEAFQLSPEHEAAKEKLRRSLRPTDLTERENVPE